MSNKIIYWPHKDRESPLWYIRTKESTTQGAIDKLAEVFYSHENIKQTLIDWFDSTNPDSVFSQLSERFDLDKKSPVKISFINYGNTELVYLAEFSHKKKFTILINQPHTPITKIRQEFENLKRLHKIDPKHIVEPYCCFSNEWKKYEFYITEYINNAFCAGHLGSGLHGVWNPKWYYHFEMISPDISREFNKNMIALLVNYYDQEQGMWLTETEISGNDFLLTRDFKVDIPETVKNNIKLISARNRTKIPFNEYLNLIRKEFLIWTDRDMEDVVNWKIKINHKSIKPMSIEEIEEWIKLWLEMKKQSLVWID